MQPEEYRIAVIGLGYVGLPVAIEFGKKYRTIGYDIDIKRIEELRNGVDRTLEVSKDELDKAVHLFYTTDSMNLKDCNHFIITVPTPVDRYKRPDLSSLLAASESVGRVLKKGDIVIYESTVFPGCTQEQCVPILEKYSGLIYNRDFFCGYSPERINPGDRKHSITKIKKVISGSTPEITQRINNLYANVIPAGTHPVSSIKVAEAAKAIENAQRDINIAFINELAIIFDKMGIDTQEVLEAAGTKWNFLPFRPGLVGGHCIGVDPYYLAYKAESLGYHPEIILAGRRINDNMAVFVANRIIKMMIKKGHRIAGSKVLVLGVTFKEDCPDIRNSKVVDLVHELESFGCKVDVYDPWADPGEVKKEYDIDLVNEIKNGYDGVIIGVAHKMFQKINFRSFNDRTVIYDVKGIIEKKYSDGRL